MTAAHAHDLCCRHCTASAEQAAHHDRLLAVDTDPDQLLGLIEMAVTWHELDYSGAEVLGPQDWLTFADRHSWTRPERAANAFSLALDIVGRAGLEPLAPAAAPLARVLPLVRR